MSEMIPLAARLDLARQLADAHLKFLATYDDLIRPVTITRNPQLATYAAAAEGKSEPVSKEALGQADVTLEEAAEDVGLRREDVVALRAAGMGNDGIIRPVESTASAAQAQTEEPKKRRGRPRKEEQTTQAPESTHTPDPTSEPEAEQVFGEADLPITHSQQEVITAVEDAADEIAASTPPAEEGDPDAAPVTEIRAGLTRYLQLTDKKRMQTLRDALMEQHSFTSFSDLETRHSTRETILAQVKAAVEQAEGDDWSELLS